MSLHKYAGELAPKTMLTNIPQLISLYYTNTPDMEDESQKVTFGTSGHRGSSLLNSFNETHILAVTQVVQEWLIIKLSKSFMD